MLDDMDKDTLFYEYYKQWAQTYARFAAVIRRSIYCERSQKAWACKYDDDAKDIFAYYSGIGE